MELLIKGAVVGSALCVAALFLRKGAAAERHVLWLTGSLVLALLPFLLAFGPHWQVKLGSQAPIQVQETSQVASETLSTPFAGAPTQVASNVPAGDQSHPAGEPTDLASLIATAWATCTSLLLLRLAISLVAALYIVTKSRIYGERDGVPILLSYRLRTPATLGLVRPVILLPASAMEWSENRIELVLAHELAHIRRRDWLWNNLANVTVAVNALNPMAWYVAARLRFESELACDDAVLTAGHRANFYAQELLAISRLAQGPILEASVLGMARRSGLQERIMAMMDDRRKRGPARKGAMNISIFLFAPVLLMFAAGRVAAQEAVQAKAQPYSASAFIPSDAPIWQGSRSIAVTDSSGRPVKDAKVAVYFVGDYWGGYATSKMPLATDEKGICKFSDADFEPLSARGEPVEAIVYAHGHAIYLAHFEPNEVATTVALPRPASILLKFVGPGGNAVAGVRVKVRELIAKDRSAAQIFVPKDWQESAYGGLTDDSGEIRFNDLPPNLRLGLDVRHPRYVTLVLNAHAVGDRLHLEPIEIPSAGAFQEPVLVQLTPAGHISGTVTSNGNPVAGISLSATLPNGKGGVPAKTDVQGHYVFPGLLPGTYSVKVGQAPEGLTSRPREDVAIDGGDISGVNFELESGGLLTGSLRYKDGTIPDRYFELELSGPGYPTTDDKRLIYVRNGSFQVRAPVGDYDLYLANNSSSDPVGKATLVQRVRISAGEFNKSSIILPTPEGPEPAHSPNPAYRSDESPFFGPAKLSDGKSATLAFLQASGVRPWRPDGSLATSKDEARAVYFGVVSSSGDENRSVFARIDIDEPRDSLDCIVGVPYRSESIGWETFGDQQGRVLDMAMFRAPKHVRTSDLKLGIGHGPFRTVLDEPIDGPVLRADNASQPGVLALHIPPQYWGMDLQVVGYDRAGKKYSPCLPLSDEPNGGFEYNFCDVSVADLRRIQLKVRPWDWVTFMGVHLWPHGQP